MAMEHGYHFVDLVDKTGKPVGQKQRRDIDKSHDIYHTVHTLLITPLGELVFSQIPQRDDLPNLYAHKLGSTVATIRRSHETAGRAAERSVARELFIDDAKSYHVGDMFKTVRDHHSSYMSTFYLIGNPPQTYSRTDSAGFVILTPAKLRKQLLNDSQRFAPTFLAIWDAYKLDLPL